MTIQLCNAKKKNIRLTSRLLDFLIKLILLIAVGLVFYYQIFTKANIDEMSALFLERLKSSSRVPLILALVLVPFNCRFSPQLNFGNTRSRQAVAVGI